MGAGRNERVVPVAGGRLAGEPVLEPQVGARVTRLRAREPAEVGVARGAVTREVSRGARPVACRIEGVAGMQPLPRGRRDGGCLAGELLARDIGADPAGARPVRDRRLPGRGESTGAWRQAGVAHLAGDDRLLRFEEEPLAVARAQVGVRGNDVRVVGAREVLALRAGEHLGEVVAGALLPTEPCAWNARSRPRCARRRRAHADGGACAGEHRARRLGQADPDGACEQYGAAVGILRERVAGLHLLGVGVLRRARVVLGGDRVGVVGRRPRRDVRQPVRVEVGVQQVGELHRAAPRVAGLVDAVHEQQVDAAHSHLGVQRHPQPHSGVLGGAEVAHPDGHRKAARPRIGARARSAAIGRPSQRAERSPSHATASQRVGRQRPRAGRVQLLERVPGSAPARVTRAAQAARSAPRRPARARQAATAIGSSAPSTSPQ